MYSEHNHRSVRGGALYYVIFVVFVLTAITLLFMLYRSVRINQLHEELDYYKKTDQLSSALTLYLSQPEVYQRGQSPERGIILFGDSSASVQINKQSHGLLDIITASTDYRGKILSKSLLSGKDPFNGDSIALYVPDKRQTLYASGETLIRGNAVIPIKGMQRASIEGKPLKTENPIEGKISPSKSVLPALHAEIRHKIECIQNFDSISSIGMNILSLYGSSLKVPLTNETSWYWSDNDYQISGIEAEGRIGFVSSGTILIRSDSDLDGVLVSASNIIVEEGFRGKVQLFAKDSLLVDQNCELRFPSVLCVYNDNVNPVFIKIGSSTLVEGVVVGHQLNLSTQKPLLILSENSLVKGQIYHQGIIELLGSIHGSLYCEGFYRKTKRAYYENHLLDNEIDFAMLPEHFVSVDLINGYNDQVLDIIDSSL